LITLAAGAGAASAAANAMGSFFVLSAVSIGVRDARAGLLAAAGSVVSLVVRLLMGMRADRRDVGHLRVVSALCGAGAAGLAMLAVGQPALLLPGAIVGYGAGWGWAGLFNFAITQTYPRAPGRATGLTQVGASAGACLGPLCFGLAAGRFGYPTAWVGGAVLLLAAALVIRHGRAQLYAAGIIPAVR
jgi:MFS family permease